MIAEWAKMPQCIFGPRSPITHVAEHTDEGTQTRRRSRGPAQRRWRVRSRRDGSAAVRHPRKGAQGGRAYAGVHSSRHAGTSGGAGAPSAPRSRCDYCAMELAALTAIHDQVKGLGATLIGISPQAPEARIRCDAPEPPFPLLFDAGAKLARRCRIAFAVSDELRPIYTAAGRRPLPGVHDSWLLPLPATYVVDWTGEVVFSHVNTDYTNRLEPADIITVVAHLARRMDRERPHRVRRAASQSAARRHASE